MPLKTHVAAPGSTNYERLTARPAREGFVIICACTGPIGAGIVAVYVERGRPKVADYDVDGYKETNIQRK